MVMRFIYDRAMNGIETVKDPLYFNTYSYGRLKVKDSCSLCKKCIKECPTGAINIENSKAFIDDKICIYCGRCIDFCTEDAIENTHDYKMADLNFAGNKLKEKIYRSFNRSLVLRSVDTGSCNACMQELNALNNTYYAISKFGIEFAASPRHADGLVVTGPVTINMKEALIKTYNAMAEPKIVIAAGSCAHNGGLFKDSYGVISNLNNIIPVDLTIPGCPPSPQGLIYGLLMLMDRI